MEMTEHKEYKVLLDRLEIREPQAPVLLLLPAKTALVLN
jgi:hypothetical protein